MFEKMNEPDRAFGPEISSWLGKCFKSLPGGHLFPDAPVDCQLEGCYFGECLNETALNYFTNAGLLYNITYTLEWIQT